MSRHFWPPTPEVIDKDQRVHTDSLIDTEQLPLIFNLFIPGLKELDIGVAGAAEEELFDSLLTVIWVLSA